MGPDETRLIEHLATTSRSSLRVFCAQVRAALALPPFEFDSENETEWGWTLTEGGVLEVNVSRPYRPGTLQERDASVPEGCNFGVSLVVSRQAPERWTPEWTAGELVPPYAWAIAGCCGAPVYHHRTWVGPGRNLPRSGVFHPG
jgi:hypothetical protein